MPQRDLPLAMVVLVGLTYALAAQAADMTAREVTSALFKSSPDAPINLQNKDLSRLDLADLNFKGADLKGADLFGADLSSTDLSKANLSGARLDRATITSTRFDGADLSGASILRPTIFSSLSLVRSEPPSFSNARMVGVRLTGNYDLVSFRGADLTGAAFGVRDGRATSTRVSMKACDFRSAKLRDADLSWNAIPYGKFRGADLRGADLSHSDLLAADFTGADITGADFSGANLEDAKFDYVTGLKTAKGLPVSIALGALQ